MRVRHSKGEHFQIIKVGIVAASVCTDLSDEKATARLNAEHPTGIRSRWAISDAPTFATGQSNPCPCEHDSSRRHILFSC